MKDTTVISSLQIILAACVYSCDGDSSCSCNRIRRATVPERGWPFSILEVGTSPRSKVFQRPATWPCAPASMRSDELIGCGPLLIDLQMKCIGKLRPCGAVLNYKQLKQRSEGSAMLPGDRRWSERVDRVQGVVAVDRAPSFKLRSTRRQRVCHRSDGSRHALLPHVGYSGTGHRRRSAVRPPRRARRTAAAGAGDWRSGGDRRQ